MDADGQILGHKASFDGLDDRGLKVSGELDKLRVAVELSTVSKTAGPGEDGGDGVGGGGTTLLVLAPVTSDSTVGGLSLYGLSIRGDEDGSHEAETAVPLRDDVRLYVTVIVLAGPNEAAGGLEGLSNHVVDETVLVPNAELLEGGLVLGLVDLGEDLEEATVVRLKDGVLGGKVERPLLLNGVLEAGEGESTNGLLGVVHAHGDTGGVELIDLVLHGFRSISGGEGHLKLSRAGDTEIGGLVLVTKGVAANDDGLGPAGNEAGDVLANDRLTEDGAIENVAEGAVGALPHLLQVELNNAGFIRGDGGALDTNIVLLNGLSSIKGDLIVGSIPIRKTKIVVENVQVQVGKDELFLNHGPDDPGHLIAVEINDRVGNLNLSERHFG
mmetsp:Transcript_23346/g.41461  ORF Transcript_23346/g.41461 Transcript_23346/m.41461 type:complete len:385 (+) Transcript_23346:275-1429(+)